MNLPGVILVLSLAANLVLASFVIGRRPSANSAPVVASVESAAPYDKPGNESSGENSATTAADTESASLSSQLNRFHWSQLESTDYKEYLARLRAFGVPEKVIRDIIIADVNKLYRPRFAALRPPKKPKNPNFWENRNQNYFPDRDMTKEQREQTRALRKEQTNLIKELLGVGVYEEMAKDSGQPDWTERLYGPLPKEVRDKISEMQEQFQDERTAFYANNDGYMDGNSQVELAAIRKKFRAELATVLTPEQLEEYELRSSETAQQMKWELSSFDPDEKEFRAIHAYKQAKGEFDAARNNEDKPLSPDEHKELQQKQKALEASLAETLGTNRSSEFKLMEQHEYRSLLDAGVPKESVFKIPDIKKEAEAAASKLRNDKSLTDEQRTAALQAIKTETAKALAEMLGERRAKYYQSSGGWWLRNLAPSN